MKSVLVIGAGGFIGGFIVAEALKRGYQAWAGVRESTSRRYLEDPRIQFVTFDYDDSESIVKTLEQERDAHGPWDYIIWNLGATKCSNFRDFNHINFGYVRTFVEALQQTDMVPERFLYMSSLSALGPCDEVGYTPITSKSIPNPNTKYGLSKIKAETFLETQSWLPWIIFRPTGVYGPHEQDYLMMIKSIDRHVDVGMGYKKQLLTFIYVDDLVDAMFDALAAGVMHKKYIISEDRAYTQQEFRQIVSRHLGGKWVLPITLPMWMVYGVSTLCEQWGKWSLKPTTLNRDKYKIMKQRNWSCDISDAQHDFGFEPKISLDEGIKRTVANYLSTKNV